MESSNIINNILNEYYIKALELNYKSAIKKLKDLNYDVRIVEPENLELLDDIKISSKHTNFIIRSTISKLNKLLMPE
jgi:hypothetical protein